MLPSFVQSVTLLTLIFILNVSVEIGSTEIGGNLSIESMLECNVRCGSEIKIRTEMCPSFEGNEISRKSFDIIWVKPMQFWWLFELRTNFRKRSSSKISFGLKYIFRGGLSFPTKFQMLHEQCNFSIIWVTTN